MGGLLPEATANNKGLISSDHFKTTLYNTTIPAGRFFKICSLQAGTLLFSVIAVGVGCLMCVSNANSGKQYIKVSKVGTFSVGESHFSIYCDDEGIYLYSANNELVFDMFRCRPAYSLNYTIVEKEITTLTKLF